MLAFVSSLGVCVDSDDPTAVEDTFVLLFSIPAVVVAAWKSNVRREFLELLFVIEDVRDDETRSLVKQFCFDTIAEGFEQNADTPSTFGPAMPIDHWKRNDECNLIRIIPTLERSDELTIDHFRVEDFDLILSIRQSSDIYPFSTRQ